MLEFTLVDPDVPGVYIEGQSISWSETTKEELFVKSDSPFTASDDIAYMEWEVAEIGNKTKVLLGVASGSTSNLIALSSDGFKSNVKNPVKFSQPWGENGAIIGIGLKIATGEVFITIQGDYFGVIGSHPKKTVKDLCVYAGANGPLTLKQVAGLQFDVLELPPSLKPTLDQLVTAVLKKDIDTVKWIVRQAEAKPFIDKWNKDGKTVLYIACHRGEKNIIKAILDAGASIEAKTRAGATAFYIACQLGALDIVQLLVEYGAAVNAIYKGGFTPLYIAAMKGHVEVVHKLINVGAIINVKGGDGSSPLYIASQNGFLEITKLLVSRGAFVEDTFRGYSPVYAACMRGHSEIVEYLAQMGANLNQRGGDKSTPLYVAAQNGHHSVVKFLLKYGAHKDMMFNNLTPRDIAKKRGFPMIANLLRDFDEKDVIKVDLQFIEDKPITEKKAAVDNSQYHVFTWGQDPVVLCQPGKGMVLSPTPIISLQNIYFKKISTGGFEEPHVLALTAKGEIWSWGYGGTGKLGHGDMLTRLNPKQIDVTKSIKFQDISASSHHSAAISTDGGAFSWGLDILCGDPETKQHFSPWRISEIKDVEFAKVTAAECNTLALSDTGELYIWGGKVGWGLQYLVYLLRSSGIENKALTPKRLLTKNLSFINVYNCGTHAYAITEDFSVYSWGDNDHGKLGHGSRKRVKKPEQVPELKCQTLSASDNHAVAVTVDGEICTWGDGEEGKLGHGNDKQKTSPTKIKSLEVKNFIATSSGDGHSLALTADGSLWAWGSGSFGELGTGNDKDSHKPIQLKEYPNFKFTAVAAGPQFSIALGINKSLATEPLKVDIITKKPGAKRRGKKGSKPVTRRTKSSKRIRESGSKKTREKKGKGKKRRDKSGKRKKSKNLLVSDASKKAEKDSNGEGDSPVTSPPGEKVESKKEGKKSSKKKGTTEGEAKKKDDSEDVEEDNNVSEKPTEEKPTETSDAPEDVTKDNGSANSSAEEKVEDQITEKTQETEQAQDDDKVEEATETTPTEEDNDGEDKDDDTPAEEDTPVEGDDTPAPKDESPDEGDGATAEDDAKDKTKQEDKEEPEDIVLQYGKDEKQEDVEDGDNNDIGEEDPEEEDSDSELEMLERQKADMEFRRSHRRGTQHQIKLDYEKLDFRSFDKQTNNNLDTISEDGNESPAGKDMVAEDKFKATEKNDNDTSDEPSIEEVEYKDTAKTTKALQEQVSVTPKKIIIEVPQDGELAKKHYEHMQNKIEALEKQNQELASKVKNQMTEQELMIQRLKEENERLREKTNTKKAEGDGEETGCFSYEDLINRPYPKAVDPAKRESYLSDAEFKEVFELTKDQFYKLPRWRQNLAKRDVNLF